MFFSGAKIEGIQLPINVSARFLSHLARNRPIRGAGRLFLTIYLKIGGQFYPQNPDHQAVLSPFFNKNQIQRFLKILVEHKLCRRDRHGNIHLTSISKTLCPKRLPDGYRIKSRHIEVPDSVLADSSEYNQFINAVDWSDLALSIKHSKDTKKRARLYAVDVNTWGTVVKNGRSIPANKLSIDSSKVQGVANSLYARCASVHKSTASRRRKKGLAAGLYDLYRWYSKLEEGVTVRDRQAAKKAGLENWNPDRMVIVDGKMCYEQPSQLIIDTSVFIKR